MSFVEDAIEGVGDFIGDHGSSIGTIAGALIGGPSGAALGGSLGSIAQGTLADTPDIDFQNPLGPGGALAGMEMPSFEAPHISLPPMPEFDFSSPFSGEVQKVLDAFPEARSRFDKTLADTRGLRSRFRPGFSEIREARLNAVDDARRRGLSNLRESLNRRNVLGSSFASDTMSRARREFARERASQAAKSFRDEIAATISALDQERAIISNDLQALAQKGQIADSAFATDVQRQASEAQAGIQAQRNALNAEIANAEAQVNTQAAKADFFSNIHRTSVESERIAAELAAAEAAGQGNLIGAGIGGLTDFLTAQDVGGDSGDGLISSITSLFEGTGEVEAGTGNKAIPFMNAFNKGGFGF